MLFFIIASLPSAISFPNSQDPIACQPPLIVPNTRFCTVSLLSGNCSSWSEVLSSPFSLPAACPPSQWAQVVLNFAGSVQGVQYDRYGALWLNGLEVLRLTTPEPNERGISWSVQKDLSYAKNFLVDSRSNLTAYLTIPNNVDSTYTGVFAVTISLTFYTSDSDQNVTAYDDYTSITPLTNAPVTSPQAPLGPLQVSGNSSLSYQVSLYTQKIASYATDGLYVQVFASQHGCEEFYYSNVPTDNSTALGICGGGVYREIQVHIDGVLAAAIYPFPVLYTGGVNPLLWRPLTGIYSFDIPFYLLDVSPFLGLLLDGESHTLTLSVLGNSAEGYWLLDAALMQVRAPYPSTPVEVASAAVTGGKIVYYSDYEPSPTVTFEHHSSSGANSEFTPGFSFTTVGSHVYTVAGVLHTAAGLVTRTTSAEMTLENFNAYSDDLSAGDTLQLVASSVSSALTIEGMRHQQTNIRVYPFVLSDSYKESAASQTMELVASIGYGYSQWAVTSETPLNGTPVPSSLPTSLPTDASIPRSSNDKEVLDELKSSFAPGSVSALHWRNSMVSAAVYNRSLTNHSLVYAESDRAAETYSVSNALSSPCYNRTLQAARGYVLRNSEDGSTGNCAYPYGEYFCSYGLCGAVSGYAPLPASSSSSSRPSSGSRSYERESEAMRIPGHARYELRLVDGAVIDLDYFSVASGNGHTERDFLSSVIAVYHKLGSRVNGWLSKAYRPLSTDVPAYDQDNYAAGSRKPFYRAGYTDSDMYKALHDANKNGRNGRVNVRRNSGLINH